jgi:tetratricopeptide (TPR) repeat protein
MNVAPDRVRDIFLAALRLPPEQRDAYLQEACPGDDLRERIKRLIQAHVELGSIVDAAASPTSPPLDSPTVSEQAGLVLAGRYQLLEPIGEGGMGTVWMAQQTEPVKRLVAVKLIKAGMDSKQVIARFEAERQALALMDHANIARVLDGGTSGAGRPYFVMDLVKGVPITRYCDEHRLTPRQRLELFLSVCQALQHAHQKGIIHRDLKPSNVLVALYDGKPVPKVIDFGVAKAAGQPLTEKSLVTGFGAVVGTPEYMSPEQAEINQLDIDTRSDIYSLGALLYELLTGSPPFTRKEVEKGGLLEMLRVIREQEPTRPSAKLSTADGLPTLAANRGMEPAKLTRLVRGELDWIVLKALEKDRNRRYETADAFAADVQRYLNDETVLACPPSAFYRLRKFVRRKKAALATVAAVALVVLVAAGSVGWTLNERRERHRRNADEIVRAVDEGWKFLVQRRWPEALAPAQHARKVLDHTEGHDALRPRVEELLDDLEMIQKLEEIELRMTAVNYGSKNWCAGTAGECSRAFRDYGIDVLALGADAVAEQIRKRRIAEYLVESLDTWAWAEEDPTRRAHLRAVMEKADPEGILARISRALQRGDRAELRTILAGLDVGRVPPATLGILRGTLFQSGLHKEAIEWLRAAHAAHPGDFWINQNLANAHAWTDPPQWGEALRHYTAALALRPQTPWLYVNIGVALKRLGKRDAALAAWRKALDLRPNFAPALSNIGGQLTKDRKYGQAEVVLRQAVAHQPDLVMAHYNLGCLYGETKRTKEALASFDRALDLDPGLAPAYSGRGMMWVVVKEFDRAVADFHLALKHDNKLAEAYHGLGWVCEQKKQYADAIKWYETAVRHAPLSVPTLSRLGDTYWALGRQEAASGSRQRATDHFDKAIARYKDAIRLDKNNAEAWYRLGNASHDSGQIRAAVTAFEKAAALKPASDDAEYQPHYNLGHVYGRLGDYPKAVAAYRAAIGANPGYARAYANLALALADQGDFAAAEKAAAAALARDKKDLKSVLNLAMTLDRQGRYAEALAFLQQSVQKLEGSKEQGARIKRLIGLYEHLARLQKQLPAILRGEEGPAAGDLLHLGEVCLAMKDYAAAARFYREAFAKQPAVAASLQDGYRFDAARAAACAGRGLDRGAALTPAEQTRWRKQALDWLRADLSLWARNIEKGGPIPAPACLQGLQLWRHHVQLAGVRGAAIDRLEPDERDDWRKLWGEVDRLVKRIPVP